MLLPMHIEDSSNPCVHSTLHVRSLQRESRHHRQRSTDSIVAVNICSSKALGSDICLLKLSILQPFRIKCFFIQATRYMKLLVSSSLVPSLVLMAPSLLLLKVTKCVLPAFNLRPTFPTDFSTLSSSS